MQKRSKGVTILAVLFVLGGAINIYSNLLMPSPALKAFPFTYQLVSSLLGTSGFIIGIGLFLLKEWARIGMIILEAAGVLWAAISLTVMDAALKQAAQKSYPNLSPQALAQSVLFTKIFMVSITVVTAGVIIFFLTRPKVVEQFKLSS